MPPAPEEVESMYDEVMEAQLVPLHVRQNLKSIMSLEKKWATVLYYKSMLRNEISTNNASFGNSDKDLLHHLQYSHFPDISKLLQLKSRIFTANKSWMELFIAHSGITILIKAMEDRLNHAPLSELDAAILFELIGCSKKVMNSSSTMEKFITTPGAVEAIVHSLNFDFKILALQVLEVLSVLCDYSEIAAEFVLTCVRKLSKSRRESPAIFLVQALLHEDVEVKVAVIRFVNNLLAGLQEYEIRQSFRRDLKVVKFEIICGQALDTLLLSNAKKMTASSLDGKTASHILPSKLLEESSSGHESVELPSTKVAKLEKIRSSVLQRNTLLNSSDYVDDVELADDNVTRIAPNKGIMAGTCTVYVGKQKGAIFGTGKHVTYFYSIEDESLCWWAEGKMAGPPVGFINTADILELHQFPSKRRIDQETFEIVTHTECITLSCPSEVVKEKWLTALQAAKNSAILKRCSYAVEKSLLDPNDVPKHVEMFKKQIQVYQIIAEEDNALSRTESGLDLADVEQLSAYIHSTLLEAGLGDKFISLLQELLFLPPETAVREKVWNHLISSCRRYRKPRRRSVDSESEIDSVGLQSRTASASFDEHGGLSSNSASSLAHPSPGKSGRRRANSNRTAYMMMKRKDSDGGSTVSRKHSSSIGQYEDGENFQRQNSNRLSVKFREPPPKNDLDSTGATQHTHHAREHPPPPPPTSKGKAAPDDRVALTTPDDRLPDRVPFSDAVQNTSRTRTLLPAVTVGKNPIPDPPLPPSDFDMIIQREMERRHALQSSRNQQRPVPFPPPLPADAKKLLPQYYFLPSIVAPPPLPLPFLESPGNETNDHGQDHPHASSDPTATAHAKHKLSLSVDLSAIDNSMLTRAKSTAVGVSLDSGLFLREARDMRAKSLCERKPTRKLKKLFWNKIKSAENTVWYSVRSESRPQSMDFNAEKLELLFSEKEVTVAKKGPSPVSRASSGPEQTSLIEKGKSQNIHIALKKLKKNPEEIVNLILELNPEQLTSETTEILLNILPTTEESELIRSYSGEMDTLGLPEKLYKALLVIPRLHERLRCHSHIFPWDEQADAVENKLRVVSEACHLLLTPDGSQGLLDVLAMVLAVGNYLNGDSVQGQAEGVRLDVLILIQNVKTATSVTGAAVGASTKNNTLLHFIADELITKDPRARFYFNDWQCVKSAAEIPLKTIAEELKTIEIVSKEAKQELATAIISKQKDVMMEALNERFGSFLDHAEGRIRVLHRRFGEVGDLVKQVLLKYGENADVEVDESGKEPGIRLLETVTNFAAAFQRALDENDMVRLEEERQRKKAEEAAKRAALMLLRKEENQGRLKGNNKRQSSRSIRASAALSMELREPFGDMDDKDSANYATDNLFGEFHQFQNVSTEDMVQSFRAKMGVPNSPAKFPYHRHRYHTAYSDTEGSDMDSDASWS